MSFLLIPKALCIGLCDVRKDYILNESKAGILPQGAGHMYLWRIHLSESSRKAATMRIGHSLITLMRIKISAWPLLALTREPISWPVLCVFMLNFGSKNYGSRCSSTMILRRETFPLSMGSNRTDTHTYCIVLYIAQYLFIYLFIYFKKKLCGGLLGKLKKKNRKLNRVYPNNGIHGSASLKPKNRNHIKF